MKVIVLASAKGGPGKTTLSSHLAVCAALSGRVAVADTDPQGGLAAWYNARVAETPAFVDFGHGMAAAIEECRSARVDYLFVDTPPSISDILGKVVSHADIVVVPVRPSPNDLRAVGGTVELIMRARKPMVFAMNQVTSRARITGEAAIALSQWGTVCPVQIAARVGFATSMTDGRTAGELEPGSKSADEISGLWSYLVGRMNGEIARVV